MTTTPEPTLAQPRLVRTGSSGPLSESIIPAEPGKFYAYSPVFTDGKPLYALMDCKANKARILAHAGELGREVHLWFHFHGTAHAQVRSVKSAQTSGLLDHANAEFDEVWVAPATIAIEDFYALCAQRNSVELAKICMASCLERKTSIDLAPQMVVAVMTSAGKYGLFLVKEIAPTSVSIDACHVLLP